MISSQFVSKCPRVCAIQFPPYRTQPLTQIDRKVLQWKRDSSFHAIVASSHNAGNKCSDAVARYQAIKVVTSHADTVIPCASIGGSPYNDIVWLALKGTSPLTQQHQGLQFYLPQISWISQISMMR